MRAFFLALVFAALVVPLPAADAEVPAARGFAHHDARATGEILPPVASGGVTGQAVLGPDERIPIQDTTVFPFSAIAFLELEDAYGEVFASCTATFIGPDALLTAGHCLWDDSIGDWGAEHIRVVPGKDGDYEPFGSQYASDWWVPDNYALSGESEWDWGVIKLPNDLLSHDTGWLSVTVAPTDVLEAPGFFPTIVGYPGDQDWGTMWGDLRTEFAVVDDFRLYYEIDTAAGQSGSAIWSFADGPTLGLIVGIHTQGGASLNSGSRIDEELLDDILFGCEVMECLISVVELDAGPGPAPSPTPTPQPTPSPTPVAPPARPYRSYGVAVARD